MAVPVPTVPQNPVQCITRSIQQPHLLFFCPLLINSTGRNSNMILRESKGEKVTFLPFLFLFYFRKRWTSTNVSAVESIWQKTNSSLFVTALEQGNYTLKNLTIFLNTVRGMSVTVTESLALNADHLGLHLGSATYKLCNLGKLLNPKLLKSQFFTPVYY